MKSMNSDEMLSGWLGRMKDVVQTSGVAEGLTPSEHSRTVHAFYRQLEERDAERRIVFRAGVLALTCSLALFVFAGAHDDYLDDLAQLEMEEEAIELMY